MARITAIGAQLSLVGEGLLRLAEVNDEGLLGNVEPDPFRDWLRDSDNRDDFA
jgi:hypothetical protein